MRGPARPGAELPRRLSGLSTKRLRGAIRGLEGAGILRWAPDAIAFGDGLDRGPGFLALLDAIPNRGRLVPVPRRILRLIAGGARPALVAAILGHLFRCLYVKERRFDARGRCKASWVAVAFGVDPRRVKDARRELVALGWLVPVDGDPQWAMNRWGRAFRIDLAWRARAETEGTGSPPPRPSARTGSPPPGSPDEEPLLGSKDQQPAGGGRPGVEISGRGGRGSAAPNLRHVVAEDLGDTDRLLALHGQAVARGLIGASESETLRFVAAAERARAVATRNTPGLFSRLIRGGLWDNLTLSDEDSARARLRAHRRPPAAAASPMPMGPPPMPLPMPMPMGPPPPPPGPSADARLVRSVRSAASGAGFRGDAFPLLRREHPEWTRDRWDRAVLELETGPSASPAAASRPGGFGLPPLSALFSTPPGPAPPVHRGPSPAVPGAPPASDPGPGHRSDRPLLRGPSE